MKWKKTEIQKKVWGSVFCLKDTAATTLVQNQNIFWYTPTQQLPPQKCSQLLFTAKPLQRCSVSISPFICFPSALIWFWGRVSVVISWKTGCQFITRLAYGDKLHFTPTLTLTLWPIIQTVFSAPTGNPRRARPGEGIHPLLLWGDTADHCGKDNDKTTSELWIQLCDLLHSPHHEDIIHLCLPQLLTWWNK